MDKAIAALVPGSEDATYLRVLQLEASGQLAEADTVLAEWYKRRGSGSTLYEIARTRQALLWCTRDLPKGITILKDRLHPDLSHQRVTDAVPRHLPTALEASATDVTELKAQARGYSLLSAVTDAGLEAFAQDAPTLDNPTPSHPSRPLLHHLLSRICRPDFPNLLALVLLGLEAEGEGSFGQLPIHGALTTPQLDELGRRRPQLWRHPEFVLRRCARLLPESGPGWERPATAEEAAERGRYLSRLRAFAAPLDPAFNALKHLALYHLLDHHRRFGGMLDALPLLKEFLDMPRDAEWRAPVARQGAGREEHAFYLGTDYARWTRLPAVRDERGLVEAYLEAFFADARDESAHGLDAFVRQDYLRRALARAKLARGAPGTDKWAEMLGQTAMEELAKRVTIQITPDNPEYYAASDRVVVRAEVQNVPSLTVQVFEMNAVNYWRATSEEVDVSIDLDGLVARHRRVFDYSDVPPVRKEVRTFQLEELSEPGTYIVELIGGGQSSRCLVRKGRLRHVEKTDAAGHAFLVLDEAGQLLTDAKILLEGREHLPDSRGLVRVPFGASPSLKRGLLVHGRLATPFAFTHLSEAYALEADVHVDREQLLEGADATAVARVRLTVHGHEAPLASLLEDRVMAVEAVDRAGAVSRKEVRGWAVVEGGDVTLTFRVPPGLASVTVTVAGRVLVASTGRRVDVSASRRHEVNGADATAQLLGLYLSRSGAGYALHALGKTGEPRAGRAVTVELQHHSFTFETTRDVQTDERGCVELGHLAGVAAITCRCRDVTRTFALTADARASLPATLNVRANERFSLACAGSVSSVDCSAFSLLKVAACGEGYESDCFASLSVEEGLLCASLPPGRYSLLIKETGHEVAIEVAEGSDVDGWIVGPHRSLEASATEPLQIAEVSPYTPGQPLRVRLVHCTSRTRLHAIATRFVPDHDAFGDLGGHRMPGNAPLAMDFKLAPTEYQSNRTLSEEYQYVLARRAAEAVPGNMLPRPSLLLNPWAVRKTGTATRTALCGDSFARGSPPLACAAAPAAAFMAKRGSDLSQDAGFSTLDFLATPSAVALNLTPDDTGLVTVPADIVDRAGVVTLVAVDGSETATRRVALRGTREVACTDRRMAQPLDPEGRYQEVMRCTVLRPGVALRIADVATAQIACFPTVASLFTLLCALSANATLRTAFEFLARWPDLSLDEKRRKYSDYACHELHLFLRRKDPAFFDDVVRPYLRHKRHKTFMDQYLLMADDKSGAELVEFLDPPRLAALNACERVLLARALDEAGVRPTGVPGATHRELERKHIADALACAPPDPETWQRLFQSALMVGSLSGSNEEFEKHKREAQDRARRGQGGREGLEKEADWEVVEREGRAASWTEEESDMCDDLMSLSAPGAATVTGYGSSRGAPPPPPALGMAPAPAPQSRSRRAEALDERSAAPKAQPFKKMALPRPVPDVAALRKEAKPLFQPVDATEELAETHYYRQSLRAQDASLVTPSRFWQDLAAHDSGPFVSGSVLCAHRSLTEALLALALTDLPFAAAATNQDFTAMSMQLRLAPGASPTAAALALHREIATDTDTGISDVGTSSSHGTDGGGTATPALGPVLVSQRLVRTDDAVRVVDGERVHKFVDPSRCVAQAEYRTQVVLTRPTPAVRKLSVLMQVPEGAVPTSGSWPTRSTAVTLSPFSAQSLEQSFYFPHPGSFRHCPACIAEKGAVVARADPAAVTVAKTEAEADQGSWEWVSQKASLDELLAYLRTENLQAVDLTMIAWRVRDRASFDAITAALRDRRCFHGPIWAYAFLHQDKRTLGEMLRAMLDDECPVGPWFEGCDLLGTVSAEELGEYEHLDYAPLINARAHRLGQRREILNGSFAAQYKRLLHMLCHKPRLADADWMAVAGYLLLQDRPREAQAAFARVRRDACGCELQYDYLHCYLLFFSECPEDARPMAQRYAQYPVLRWRGRFLAVLQHLDEARGGAGEGQAAPDAGEDRDRDARMAAAASTEPSLSLEASDGRVLIRHENAAECVVNLYAMDVEHLFSIQPFMQRDGQDRFSFVSPNATFRVTLSGGGRGAGVTPFDLPPDLSRADVMVEALSGSARAVRALYSSRLTVAVTEAFGQLRASDKDTGAPVPAAYVKVFARDHGGASRFYKDGYTDVRGRFDYASLSTEGDLGRVARFAILVMGASHGAVLCDCGKPSS